jgi:hypothetical protein
MDGFLYARSSARCVGAGAAVTIATADVIDQDKASRQGLSAKTGQAAGLLPWEDVYYAQRGDLAEGDSVIPITLNRISFVTDVSDQAQGQSYDVTTQDDIESGARAWIPSAFKDRSGTINGFVDTDSEEQRTLLGEYRKIVVDDGEHVTVHDAASVEHEFMLSKRETLTEGEIELWEYLPVISESINTSKPLDGAQPFSFNYKVDGKRKPCAYYRTVGA